MTEPSHTEAMRTAILHGAPCTREEYIAGRDALPPKAPKNNYSVGVVILWSIACLALGFSFCALCLGCGPIVPAGSNTCCYGSTDPNVQECAGFLNGCTFIATQDDGGCGEMVCD